jgi:deoxyribose-phosphate aldolase
MLAQLDCGKREAPGLSSSIVSLIDHAVLQPTSVDADVRSACRLCANLRVASVCVRPADVALAAEVLAGSPVAVGTVIGFPHGGTATEIKVAEAELVCRQGATEIDMVVNIGRALGGDWAFVENDICAVVDRARSANAITKVILETGLLPSDELKIRLCKICAASGAAFVKTSTGFGFIRGANGAWVATGATEHDVQLLRASCGRTVGVKASGGIQTYEAARRFVELGATRLGTSHTLRIAEGEMQAATSRVH